MADKKKRIRFSEANVEPPKPTFFFQFPNGKPFATEEKDAWELFTGKGSWTRQGVKYIGQTDGLKSYQARLDAAKVRTPKHDCTLITEGDCYTCEDTANESMDIIRKGFEDELADAPHNTAAPTKQNVYFMDGMTKEQKADVNNQLR